MPSFEKLTYAFAGKGLEIITIDVKEEMDVVKQFIKTWGYSFKVYLDSDGTITSHYEVRNHPKSFIIDPSGRVIGVANGYRPWDSNEAILMFKLLTESLSETKI
ncbi:MAG: TlpA family protein disulfide reductase [Nitrospirota bacterium]|nr:MAG: TlpA family protein disulfide reductase [Nitrospirota bacterium]